jgi:predicted Zn-dependent protease
MSVEAVVLETVLKSGQEAGFSTVEAFGEKITSQECAGVDQPLSRHETRSDRLLARVFRDRGDPLGFSLSSPDARRVKRGFAALASGSGLDGKKNFAHLLPKSVQKIKLDIFDPDIERWDENQASELRERVRESMATFPGLKLKKFYFSRALKKIYLANSRGFMAKYKKTHFQVQMSFMLQDHALELSESRIHFSHFDPQRLVARAANLLGSLNAGGGKVESGTDLLVMSPEASVQVLKEFSSSLKLDRSAARERGVAASPRVSILDNPALDQQPGSVPFDDEGTSAAEKYLVNKGVFVEAAADIRSGFEMGKSSTGNGFRDEGGIFPQVQFTNLYFKPSNVSFSQLLSQAQHGILVYLVKRKGPGRHAGEHVFSAYGYGFDHNEITRAVHFQFSTSWRSYLLHILEISRELRFFHSRANIGSPYLLLQGRRDAEKNILI